MKTLLFTIIAILSLQGCFNSKITTTPELITLSHNDLSITKEATTVSNTTHLYPHVTVDIEIRRSKNGNFYAFEDATAGSGYDFDYSVATLVHKIFKNSHSKQFLRIENLYFFTMQTDTKHYYMLATQNMKNRLQFIYPLSKEQISYVIAQIDSGKLDSVPSLKETFTAKEAKALPLSNWSPSMIILETIVKKKGGRVVGR